MNRSEIVEAIGNIPDGRKRDHLGASFVEALVSYSKEYGQTSFTLDELIVHRLESLVHKKSFLADLKNFNEHFETRIKGEGQSQSLTHRELKDIIIDVFEFKRPFIGRPQCELEKTTNCDTKLHDFQERIRRKVMNLFFEGQKKFLIHMPTGSGKTRTAAEIILDFIRISPAKALFKNNIQILWVAQSSELCQQAYQTVKYILDRKGVSDVNFSHFYGDYTLDVIDNSRPTIHFVGIQKLLLHFQSDVWSSVRENTFLVVIDEAHRSIAQQWIKALEYFTSDESVYTIGLTATPGIGTSENGDYSLANFYQGNKITIADENYRDEPSPIQYLIRRKFLAKIDRFTIHNYAFDESVSFMDGEYVFSSKTLKSLAVSAKRNRSIVNIVCSHQDLKILIFTCGKEHNMIFSSLLSWQGIRSAIVDDSTENREAILQDFKNGELNVLLNYGVLTTGFDAPKTNICVIARPVASVVLYSQMVGRILRGPKNKGNEKNTLFTIQDNFNHGGYDEMFNTFNGYYQNPV